MFGLVRTFLTPRPAGAASPGLRLSIEQPSVLDHLQLQPALDVQLLLQRRLQGVSLSAGEAALTASRWPRDDARRAELGQELELQALQAALELGDLTSAGVLRATIAHPDFHTKHQEKALIRATCCVEM